MQQTLPGCAFRDAEPGTGVGKAHTWGHDERVTHPICVDCAIQVEPDPDKRDYHACDGCELVVDTIAASPAYSRRLPAGPSVPPGSRGLGSNSVTSRARSNSAPAVAPVDQPPTGRATSRNTAFVPALRRSPRNLDEDMCKLCADGRNRYPSVCKTCT